MDSHWKKFCIFGDRMIKVQKNYSFEGWFQIFLNGQLMDEVSGSDNALEYATNLAREHDMHYIYFIDEAMEVGLTSALG